MRHPKSDIIINEMIEVTQRMMNEHGSRDKHFQNNRAKMELSNAQSYRLCVSVCVNTKYIVFLQLLNIYRAPKWINVNCSFAH